MFIHLSRWHHRLTHPKEWGAELWCPPVFTVVVIISRDTFTLCSYKFIHATWFILSGWIHASLLRLTCLYTGRLNPWWMRCAHTDCFRSAGRRQGCNFHMRWWTLEFSFASNFTTNCVGVHMFTITDLNYCFELFLMWVFLLDGKVLTIKDPNFSTTEQAFTKNHPNLYEVLCKNFRL